MSEDEIKAQEAAEASEVSADATAPVSENGEISEGDVPEELHPKPEEILAILEALTFVSKEPVTMKDLMRVFKGVDKTIVEAQVEGLKALYSADNRGLQFIEVAGGYQITSRPEHNEWVRELLDPKSPARLSTQALETLAVIAYKQPATLPEIIELRGIKSGGVVKTLLERRLIKIVGRKEVVGRPLLYGTTKEFLLQFGLKDLEDLPKIEDFAEILGEDVDVMGLKRALETPTPIEVPLFDSDPPDPAQRDLSFDSTVDANDITEAAARAAAEAAGTTEGADAKDEKEGDGPSPGLASNRATLSGKRARRTPSADGSSESAADQAVVDSSATEEASDSSKPQDDDVSSSDEALSGSADEESSDGSDASDSDKSDS